MLGRREHQRARIDHLRQDAGIILRIGRDLGKGDVAGCFDEFLELPVGHRLAVHPEAVDGDAMGRRFFGIVPVRAHAERAARNPDHSFLNEGVCVIDALSHQGNLVHPAEPQQKN